MSTLTVTNVKATNIQDSAGANGTTPAQISQGRAKAWIRFDGTGTPAVTDSFNCSSSITDNGTGDYTVSFSTDLTNANYAAVTGIGSSGDGEGHYFATLHRVNSTGNHIAPTTSAFRVTVANSGGTSSDSKFVNVVIFGD